jgi:hypothetical protein
MFTISRNHAFASSQTFQLRTPAHRLTVFQLCTARGDVDEPAAERQRRCHADGWRDRGLARHHLRVPYRLSETPNWSLRCHFSLPQGIHFSWLICGAVPTRHLVGTSLPAVTLTYGTCVIVQPFRAMRDVSTGGRTFASPIDLGCGHVYLFCVSAFIYIWLRHRQAAVPGR